MQTASVQRGIAANIVASLKLSANVIGMSRNLGVFLGLQWGDDNVGVVGAPFVVMQIPPILRLGSLVSPTLPSIQEK